MRLVRVRKRSGGYREIVVPSRKLKERLRGLLPRLEAVAMILDKHGVQHGFTPGRSPVTNALKHIGYAWTASFDLKDCFDHVTRRAVEALVGRVPGDCFYKDVAKQGLPTSPVLANLSLSPLDGDIVDELGDRGVYTRYADDLTISANERSVIEEMVRKVPLLAKKHGHEVNPSKTLVQSAASGRRIITGVAVGDKGIYPTRAAKRRLRAALHQGRKRQAGGLNEWIQLKPPNWIASAAEKLLTKGKEGEILALLIVEKNK